MSSMQFPILFNAEKRCFIDANGDALPIEPLLQKINLDAIQKERPQIELCYVWRRWELYVKPAGINSETFVLTLTDPLFAELWAWIYKSYEAQCKRRLEQSESEIKERRARMIKFLREQADELEKDSL